MTSTWARRGVLLLLLLAGGWAVGARAQATPILILVSFDGWRWDYLDRVDAPNLKALAARGVRSEGLIPSYPSLTFPNHYTIVTGLRPDRHGIVSNTMLDRSIGNDRFTMSSATAKDPRWWGGEPIWTTAIKQGRKSAAMFWPGSEAVLPTFWMPFDDKMLAGLRVAQILTWLALPPAEAPSFLTLYFSDLDSAAHRSGPDSPDVAAAAARVDRSLGELIAGIDRLGLTSRTTVMVVSDHGMAQTSTERQIVLSDYIAEDEAEIVDAGSTLGLNPRGAATVDALYRKLAFRHPSLAVYKREEAPAWLNYGSNRRVPAIIGVVEAGWTVERRHPATPMPAPRIGGAHGYDGRYRDMHGLFVAAGPRIRRGVVAPQLDNIHLYHFMCEVLGLRPATNDGDRAQTAGLFVWRPGL